MKKRILATLLSACLITNMSMISFAESTQEVIPELPQDSASETTESPEAQSPSDAEAESDLPAAPIPPEEAAIPPATTEPSAEQPEPAPLCAKLDVSQFTLVDESITRLTPSYQRGGNILFDSQNLMPETLAEDASLKITGSTWQPHYVLSWGKPAFYLDLGANYVINGIGYMDMNASPTITAYQGTPFQWETLGNIPTDRYNVYRTVTFSDPKPTRYIRFDSSSPDCGINEMALYGYKVAELSDEQIADTAAKPAVSESSHLTSGAKIGANAFCDDPYPALAALGNIREYYNWSWAANKNGLYYFNSVVNKDKYYKTLLDMGISVIPCIQGTSPLFQEEEEDWNKIKNTIPVEPGADTEDPASYATHANFMYNFAARYGSNTDIDPETLTVGDEVKIGLGYLDTAENWNEQDKNWETKDSYFTPFEYAAMTSADYDGHEGTIPSAGLKTADPNFNLAMGGLAKGDQAVSYLTLMKQWFDYNRTDGLFAVDVINYHDYITDSEAPEYSDFRTNIQNIKSWVDENAPGRDIWCSEFDVTASDLSIEGVNNHQNEAYATGRAQRLLRAFLVGEREGLDRLSMFMLRDEWSGVYGDSGLTTGKGEWDKKTSWYYVSCATDTLKNADLIDVYESEDLYVYTYEDRITSEIIYAVWTPTIGSTTTPHTLSVPETANKATCVTPTYGYMEGTKMPLTIQNGMVSVTANETVQFIKVSSSDVAFENHPQERIQVQELRLGELNGSTTTRTFDNKEVIDLAAGEKTAYNNDMLSQFYHLFDEQRPELTPKTPWFTKVGKPATVWKGPAISKEQAYPYDAIITFDDYYDITYIGIFDTYNTGKLDIYDANTDTLIYSSNLDFYNRWGILPMGNTIVSTNKIRIVKYNGAELTELAFYGFKSNDKVGQNLKPAQSGKIGKPAPGDFRKEIAGISLGKLSLAQDAVTQNQLIPAFNQLFDEQNLTPPDTKSSLEQDVSFKTNFTDIWKKTFPFDAIVRFNGKQPISKVGFFLGWGDQTGRVDIYDASTDRLLLSTNLIGVGKWVYVDLTVPVETDAIRIEKHNKRTIFEVAFY